MSDSKLSVGLAAVLLAFSGSVQAQDKPAQPAAAPEAKPAAKPAAKPGAKPDKPEKAEQPEKEADLMHLRNPCRPGPNIHPLDVKRFVGTWKVKSSSTTSLCQDGFILEHPDPATLTLFVLSKHPTSDLGSDDGDCQFLWGVEGRELKAEHGQICHQTFPDGGKLEVGLIEAGGTLQCDGTAKDSIEVSVTLTGADGVAKTCLVTIEETLEKIEDTQAQQRKLASKSAAKASSKYVRAVTRAAKK